LFFLIFSVEQTVARSDSLTKKFSPVTFDTSYLTDYTGLLTTR
jgi:hypothetical protein